MNPLIINETTLSLEKSAVGTGTQTLTYTSVKVTGESSTSFTKITIYGSMTSDLYGMFASDSASPSALNYFAIKPVVVNFHSSLYPDQNILDFYTASFEKINSGEFFL